MLMTQIPYWITLDKLKFKKFYKYKSSVTDRFFEIQTWREKDKEKYADQIEFFEAFKKKLLKKKLVVNGEETKLYWDNKVVIECEVKSGAIIFIGCFDEVWSIGLQRVGDNWIEGLEIK